MRTSLYVLVTLGLWIAALASAAAYAVIGILYALFGGMAGYARFLKHISRGVRAGEAAAHKMNGKR